jgi:hypothetical protein
MAPIPFGCSEKIAVLLDGFELCPGGAPDALIIEFPGAALARKS